jgi:hypothetical protein
MKQLIDMKNTPKEAKAEMGQPLKAPEYPWGLSINLDKVALEKLGLEGSLPALGAKFLLTAQVEVTSSNEYKSENTDDRSIGLQITAMALTTAGSAKTASKALYDADGDES